MDNLTSTCEQEIRALERAYALTAAVNDVDLLPREEQLVRLYEACARYGVVAASQLVPICEAERHRAEHGHRLSFGCCRVAA